MYTINEIKNLFICGDAVNEMKNFPSESIDLVVIVNELNN